MYLNTFDFMNLAKYKQRIIGSDIDNIYLGLTDLDLQSTKANNTIMSVFNCRKMYDIIRKTTPGSTIQSDDSMSRYSIVE